MNEEELPEFSSNDLVLVTALRCLGHEARDLDYDDDARSMYWYFEQTKELEQDVAKFALGQARVEPKEFNTLYVSTKDDMFEAMKKSGKHPKQRVR